jgi:hypothetical protein
MRAMTAGACMIASAALMGCTNRPPPVTNWNKPGFNQAQFEMDRSACLLEARQSDIAAIGSGVPRMQRDSLVFEVAGNCMRARGYTPEG